MQIPSECLITGMRATLTTVSISAAPRRDDQVNETILFRHVPHCGSAHDGDAFVSAVNQRRHFGAVTRELFEIETGRIRPGEGSGAELENDGPVFAPCIFGIGHGAGSRFYPAHRRKFRRKSLGADSTWTTEYSPVCQ